MLDRIKQFFAADVATDEDDEAALHLAAAALLIEVAKADQSLQPIELERLAGALAGEWRLDEKDVTDLVDAAKTSSEDNVSLHEHVDLINRRFSPQRKFRLLRSLWDVACADGEIHPHEELLVRRLADLIYLSHTDFIRAKHLALGES
ncbi:MAG: TerB family tellurite resistance protein [Gammaproteobacteria bacterium]|nr:TerB family tellurite resistance protein [Gammaproteobacteria bacterium]